MLVCVGPHMSVLFIGLFPSVIFLYRDVTPFPESGKTGSPCCWGSRVNLDKEIRVSQDEGRASKWIARPVYMVAYLESFVGVSNVECTP